MALIQCPECGKDVSDKAPACIHCGNPLGGPIPIQEASFSATPPSIEKQELGTGGKIGIVLITLMLTVFLLVNYFTNKTYSPSDNSSSQIVSDNSSENQQPLSDNEIAADIKEADQEVAQITARSAAKQKAKEEKDLKCRQDLQCWAEQNDSSAKDICSEAVEKKAAYDFQWTTDWRALRFDKISWANKKKGTIVYLGDRIKFQNGFGAWQIQQYSCTYDPATRKASDVIAMPRSALQ